MCPPPQHLGEKVGVRIAIPGQGIDLAIQLPDLGTSTRNRSAGSHSYRVLVTASLPHVVRHWKADIWVAKPPCRRPDSQLLTDRGPRNLGQPMP